MISAVGLTQSAPTPEQLAAALMREFTEMQEHRAQTALAHKMGAVPPDPPLSQVAKAAYVRPADPYTRVRYTGD